MTNQQFLQNYQHLQYGIMYNKLLYSSFASIAWCGKYSSSFFNHAQINSELNDNQLEYIERELKNLKRKPAVYFESREQLNGLASYLKSKGYIKAWEDSWMFYEEAVDKEKLSGTVQLVSNVKELAVFLETFDKCYTKDDPQNPYGELGDYLDVARDAWNDHHATGKIEYILVYDKNTPVAVSTLTNFAGIGYISNVGSLRDARGKGFGKTASLFAVFKSQKNGNQVHSLATEEGHYPNEFYKRIGFKTKFTALGYVKEDK